MPELPQHWIHWPRRHVVALAIAVAVAVALTITLAGCGDGPRPDLKRLYLLSAGNAETAPVILIPGVFGSRLRDRASGSEVWPGPWWRILFSSYADLALEFDPDRNMPRETALEAYDIADRAFGRDYYRPIIETLTRFGGYARATPGTPARKNERRFYVFAYDWRQDNVTSARALHQLIEAVQRDYDDPALRVDLVAHSMGGLIARYYLRFGIRDVLDGGAHSISMDGAAHVRKLVLLGTPNLGSVNSLHAFLTGEPVGLNRIAPRTLATMPSGYQLFPHPLARWLVDVEGSARNDELFDPQTWRQHRWSIFETEPDPALRRYFEHQLERARRFAWMLSAPEPVSPVRYVLFGGDCHLTPARLLVEHVEGRDAVRLGPEGVKSPRAGVAYDELMLEPGDGRVTKPSLLARETLDPSAPQHEDSFLPLAYAFFLCERHNFLTGNINFQDNLLNVLLTRQLPWESGRGETGGR